MKNRDFSIDVAKGIAIVAVVIGHVVTSYHNSKLFLEDNVANYICDFVYCFHMPLFFIISGYLAHYNDISKESLGKYISNKLISYGIPYLSFSIIDFLFKTVFKNFVNTPISIKDLCLIIIYPIGILWFLYALFLIILVHAIISALIANKRYRCAIEIFVAFILYIIAKCFVTSDLGICDTAKNAIWFVVGLYGIPHLKQWLSITNRKRKTVILLFLILFLSIENIWRTFSVKGVTDVMFGLLISLMGSVAVISISSAFLKDNKTLNFLGRSTMPIYLLHAYFISAIRIFLEHQMPLYLSFSAIKIAICTIVAVVIPIIIYWGCEKVKWLDSLFYPSKYIKIN